MIFRCTPLTGSNQPLKKAPVFTDKSFSASRGQKETKSFFMANYKTPSDIKKFVF